MVARKRNPDSKAKPPQDFASVAKRLGCDTDKDRFEAKLGKIVKAKPKKAARK
jgi:hypothetical protein